MLSTEQEQYLANLADQGIAAAEAEAARIAQAEAKRVVDAEREAKLEELKVQAEALIATGIEEFETSIKPKG
jgi:tRNA(Ser,Leu) C12 N-acetylase TAN1